MPSLKVRWILGYTEAHRGRFGYKMGSATLRDASAILQPGMPEKFINWFATLRDIKKGLWKV